MELDEAMKILSEIAEGDREREAFETVKASVLGLLNDIDIYRSLYEGAVKKLERFRDIAAVPDIHENTSWQAPKKEAKNEKE